jgi:hypothetical protein
MDMLALGLLAEYENSDYPDGEHGFPDGSWNYPEDVWQTVYDLGTLDFTRDGSDHYPGF